jgi:hypothetical protein
MSTGDQGPGRGPGRRGSARRSVAVAIVAVALAFGLITGFIAAPKAPEGTKAFLASAARPGTRFAAFPTRDGQHLAVAYRQGETGAWIFGSGLTKPAGGQTYELWWGAEGTPLERMNAAGLFVPIHGDVIAPVTLGASDPGTLLQVTVEPPGGSPRPTTRPLFATSA